MLFSVAVGTYVFIFNPHLFMVGIQGAMISYRSKIFLFFIRPSHTQVLTLHLSSVESGRSEEILFERV